MKVNLQKMTDEQLGKYCTNLSHALTRLTYKYRQQLLVAKRSGVAQTVDHGLKQRADNICRELTRAETHRKQRLLARVRAS